MLPPSPSALPPLSRKFDSSSYTSPHLPPPPTASANTGECSSRNTHHPHTTYQYLNPQSNQTGGFFTFVLCFKRCPLWTNVLEGLCVFQDFFPVFLRRDRPRFRGVTRSLDKVWVSTGRDFNKQHILSSSD